MDSASTVPKGPAAARDRAQETLRQARAASKRRKEGSAVPECAAEFRKNGNCNRAKVKEFTSMTGDSDVKVAETLLANNEWNVAQALECLRSVPVEEGNLFPSDDGQKTVKSRVFRGMLGGKATKPWRYLMCLPRSMRGIRLAAKSMPKKMQLKELNTPKSMQFQQLTAYRQAADSLAKAERCLAHARRALSTRAAALSEPEQLRSEERQATQFKELNELQRRRQHAERSTLRGAKFKPRAMPAFGTDQIHSPMHKGLRCVRATKVFCRVSLVSRERTHCLRISWPSI